LVGTLPRGIDNATCYTKDLTRCNLKKIKEKIKKIRKNQRLTRGTPLTALMIFFFEKDLIETLLQKLGRN